MRLFMSGMRPEAHNPAASTGPDDDGRCVWIIRIMMIGRGSRNAVRNA